MRVLKGIAASVAAGALALGAAGTAFAAQTADEKAKDKQKSLDIVMNHGGTVGYAKQGEQFNMKVTGCKTNEGTATSKVFDGEVQLSNEISEGDWLLGAVTIRTDAPTGKATVTVACGDKTAESTFQVIGENSPGPPDASLESGDITIVGERKIEFSVINCTSNGMGVKSSVVADHSYERTTDSNAGMLTLTLKKGTKPGTYPISFTCEGQPPEKTEITLTEAMVKDRGGDNNGGNNNGDDNNGDDNKNDGGNNNGGDDNKGPKPEPQPRLTYSVTDGFFTADDRGVALKIENCRSNDVSVSSPAFSSTSYNKKTHIVSAQITAGIADGTYKMTITCKGQKPLHTKVGINESPTGDTGNNNDGTTGGNGDNTGNSDATTDGNDQTTEIPEGAAQTGGGATAGTRVTAGALR